MKKLLIMISTVFLFTGCNVTSPKEDTTEETTMDLVTESLVSVEEESETEETTEVIEEPETMDKDQRTIFKGLNYSYKKAEYLTDSKAQYASMFKSNKLYRIAPIVSGKDSITDNDELEVEVSKGYITVAPVTTVKATCYIKLNDVIVNIPSESIIYFSEPVKFLCSGIIINNSARTGFLNLPTYTSDGIMHNDGFDTSKYENADLSVDYCDLPNVNDYNPNNFDILEPNHIDVELNGGVVCTYDSKSFDGTYYLYNEIAYSETGSKYTLYKDDEVVYKGLLPSNCRMVVDFKDYDKITIECGLLVKVKN